MGIAKRKLSRRIPTPIQAAAKKHARHIGEIMLSWTEFQHSLFVLFWAICMDGRTDDFKKARAIWHMFQSDKNQREMLLAVSQQHPMMPKKLLDHIKWVVSKAEKLSAYRNDAAHMPVLYLVEKSGIVSPIPKPLSGKPSSVERLTQSPTATIWRRVRGDLTILTDFCRAIYEHMVLAGLSGPWPNRPPLLSLPKISPKRRKKSRPTRRAKP